jgi:MarR family transcriptional regulator, organic hydroperoxide resistance regulator
MTDDPVSAIQRFYPQIYLACHRHHVRAVSTPYRLSAQDSGLLTHLDDDQAVLTGALAKHLGLSASTLSASVKRLESLGYIVRTPRASDRRQIELRLTAKGAEAMAGASALDRRRIVKLLGQLTPSESRQAVDGLALLARAARHLQIKQPQPR